MKVLQLSAHFRPNIGGVETHLDDLVKSLIKRDWEISVLTYKPLTTRISWKIYETSKNLTIFRIPWVGGFFYTFVAYPLIEFIYLFPGLFFILPSFLLWRKPNIIHAHGLVAGFIGVFWGRIFNIRVVISTHSIYSFPKQGVYRNFVTWIFKNADYCLGLSKQAAKEIISLGINKRKVGNFTYWIDLNKFKIQNEKFKIKEKLGWDKEFVVLFVGRLVKEKGVDVLLEAAKIWDGRISLKIIGGGPMENLVKSTEEKVKNLRYLGPITQDKLPTYFNGSDILIIPSTSEEGFGRVILESLACGTPILGSNRGAIGEAIDETVGRLIEINPENIKKNIEYFYENKKKLARLAKNCRKLAERRFSEKNVDTIIHAYER